MNLKIEGSYLCQFDTTQGNSLLQYQPYNDSKSSFTDLEYLSLPSGLHDIAEAKDIVKFQILDDKKDKFFSIARLYNNSKSIINDLNDLSASIDRNKVKIFSVGLIFKLDSKTDTDLLEYQESIIKIIDILYEKFSLGNINPDSLLNNLKTDLTNVEKSLAWKEPFQILKDIDCFIFPLWKSLMLKKSILIINNDSKSVSFDELNRLVEYLKTISNCSDYDLVYNCSLSNFESVLSSSRHKYIAYTTDLILKDTVDNYQVVLELGKNGKIQLLDNNNKPLHATYIEGLKLISKYKNDFNKFDSKGKSQKIIDFVYLLFTFNTMKPAYYKFVNMAVDIPLQAPLEPKRFEKWLSSLDSGIESLIKTSNAKVLILKPSDVLMLGFDGFNQNDLLFLKEYITKIKYADQVEKVVFKNFDINLFI
ncbi:unnamed protein product [Hanseniaspora opuntiae]